MAAQNNNSKSRDSLSPRQQEDFKTLNNRIAQLEQDKPLHEMIEAIYLELGRALHGISNITDSSLPEFLDQYSEKTKQQIDHLQQDLQEKVNLTEKTVQETKNSLIKDIEQKNSEIDNLKGKLAHNTNELNSKHSEIDNLKNKLTHNNKELNNKNIEIDNLKSKLQDKELEINRLQESFVNKQRLHEQEVANLQTKLDYDKIGISNLQETLSREQEARREITNRFWADKDNLVQEKEHYRTLLQFRDYEIAKLKETAKNLERWIKQLDEGISELLHSKRWKIGNLLGEFQRKILFKPKQPMPEEHLENVLLIANSWKQNNVDLLSTITKSFSQKHPSKKTKLNSVILLTRWIEKLENGYNALLESKRWKAGNAVGEIKHKVLFKQNEPMPADYINNVFKENKNQKNQIIEQSDLKSLTSIMDRLEKGLSALVGSSRWKTGCKIGNFQQRLLFRQSEPLPSDLIEDVLSKYKHWKTNKSI